MNELKMPYGVPMRPNMTHTIVFSLLLLLLSVCPVWGQTYYVKSGGSDSAAGTSDGTAWATISKVTSTVTSGDTVYFRSQDTWTNVSTTLVLNATAGVTYIGNAYGSGTRATIQVGKDASGADAHAVRISRSNVTLRGFNVNMNNKRAITGIFVNAWYSADVNNTTIDNCEVHHSTGIQGTDWSYGILVGSTIPPGYMISNTTITNTTVHDVFHEGIAIYSGWGNANNRSDNTLVSGCSLYNNPTGILIANDAGHVTLEHNFIDNNMYNAIYIRVSPTEEGPGNVTVAPNNFIIRYNYISNNPSNGIEIADCRSYVMTGSIYNNIFYNNGATGIGGDAADIMARVDHDYVYGVDWYFPAGTIFNIYNNTFYSNVNHNTNIAGVFLLCVGGATCGSPTVNFKNNIIQVGSSITSTSFRPIWDRGSTLTSQATHSNNLIYRASSATAVNVLVGTGTTYDRNGGAADLTNWEATAKKTDPLFVSTLTPNFRLQSSSPAINAGVNVRLTTDYLGNAIVGLLDIGAYEFQPSRNPLSPTGLIIQ